MSKTTVQLREKFRTVTPYIFIPEAEELIGFVQQVFGGVETGRTKHENGALHVEVRVGDSMMMIGGGPAFKGPRKAASLRVLVENSDEVYQRALDAGARSQLPMTEAHGERFGCVRDSFGNQWIVATQIGPSYAEGLDHSITTFVTVPEAARFIDFLERGFGAAQLLRVDGEEGKIKHSVIRVGDSVVCVSDTRDEAYPPGLFLYVSDVDAWYARAVRAGAQPTMPPTDQSYGDRGAGVTDAWGNFWYLATPR